VGEDQTLHTANLGDSGFLIARAKEGEDKLELLFKTPFQQHDFNTPFQLSTMGPDEPWHADVEKFVVENGDILVMGTDGLWDNVYDADVLEALSSGSTPQQMADRLPPITAHLCVLPPNAYSVSTVARHQLLDYFHPLSPYPRAHSMTRLHQCLKSIFPWRGPRESRWTPAPNPRCPK
jgi:hypothetical protein